MILLKQTKGTKIYCCSLCLCGVTFSFRFSKTWFIRFSGTIIGVEDISPHWVNSKWRSLKVLSSLHLQLFTFISCGSAVLIYSYHQFPGSMG